MSLTEMILIIWNTTNTQPKIYNIIKVFVFLLFFFFAHIKFYLQFPFRLFSNNSYFGNFCVQRGSKLTLFSPFDKYIAPGYRRKRMVIYPWDLAIRSEIFGQNCNKNCVDCVLRAKSTKWLCKTESKLPIEWRKRHTPPNQIIKSTDAKLGSNIVCTLISIPGFQVPVRSTWIVHGNPKKKKKEIKQHTKLDYQLSVCLCVPIFIYVT